MNQPERRLSGPESRAWRGFLGAYSHIIGELDTELGQAEGLPLTSYEVLLHLAGAPGHSLRMAELADRILLSRSGLTRLVDRLARRGLVERRACPSDRRGCSTVLTGEGMTRLRSAAAVHVAGVRRHVTNRLSAQELEAMAALFEKLSQPEKARPGPRARASSSSSPR